MNNEKLIAQISSSEETMVDRVSLRLGANSSLSSRMSSVEELRKKTIRIEGMAKSRLTKLRLQESFEKLKNNLPFEYGDNLILNLKSNELVIYSRWIEGVTLKENHLKEESFKIEDIPRLKNKLRLWVRIFEHLSIYHSHGIVHGNIKPENILIRDRSTVDLKQVYNSEFFEKKLDIPHVTLLDGGYRQFIEFQKECLDSDVIRSQVSKDKKIWLAPEAHGLLEGSYKENSDIFSLAAIMAWDFGLIKSHKTSILNSLWSIHTPFDTNSFCLGNKIYKWANRNSLSDMVKRLRTVLARALEPMSEKRTISARDVAFEIMLMTNRLVDSLESSPIEVYDIYSAENLTNNHKKDILTKKFELPDKLIPFLLKEESLESNRLWIEARNKSANKHAIMRSLNSGLNIIGHNACYFGAKMTQSKIPYYNLDLFCNNLLSYVLHINPEFIEEIRAIFNDIGTQIYSIFFVLPSLKNYTERIEAKIKSTKNNVIQIQHESVKKNIEDLILKIIIASKLQFIIVDDINRADHSTIQLFINLFNLPIKNLKWIIGIRLDEEMDSEDSRHQILQLKHKDLSFASIKDNRTISYWITKLNTLSKVDANMLSIFSVSSSIIDFETFEILSNKFINSSGSILSENPIMGDYIKNNDDFDDYIPYEDLVSTSKIPAIQDSSDDKKNKDSLYLAVEVLKRAIQLGLVTENRDVCNGYLVSYYWEHQFVLQCLSMLLKPKLRTEINHSLFKIYQASIDENESLAKIINITDFLIKSKINHCYAAAYSSLLIASEKLCDIYSAEYIIKKFQILEEEIELERPKEASALITKIREKIADISRSINKNDIAVKYYDAVSWNIINRKKISILMLKSFFPSQIKNRELRIKEFYKILTAASKSGFFPNIRDKKTFDFKSKITNIINKIQRNLSVENSYLNNNEDQDQSRSFKNILKNIDDVYKENNEELNNAENTQTYKVNRDKVMSYFLRTCVGWVDNSHIYPYVIEALHLASDNFDGESTIQLLITLVLTCERNISIKLRSAILETITDLTGRIGGTFTLYEVLLIKAWYAMFFDGNLIECKKNIERLNSSYFELPYSIRQCTKKLQILYEFETLSVQAIDNRQDITEKYLKKFNDFGLKDWAIGYEITHLKSTSKNLKIIPGDELFVGNILNEKTDQVLLYTYYLVEEDHANASNLVINEAKNLNMRQWLNDPSSHIEYAPEKLAAKFIEFSLMKNVDFDEEDKSKYFNFKSKMFKKSNRKNELFIQRYFNRFKHMFLLKNYGSIDIDSDATYWGHDKSIIYNIKLDVSKTQDTEKLHFLAQSLVRTGFLWTSFRVAHKARSTLGSIFDEMRELEANMHSSQNQDVSAILTAPKLKEEESYQVYEKSVAYPEQGVALNYVLEFLHNFQNHIHESKLTHSELKDVSEFIKKSIPKDTDIIESTLAGALKATAKRLQNRIEEDVEEKPKLSIVDLSNENDINNNNLPKAG